MQTCEIRMPIKAPAAVALRLGRAVPTRGFVLAEMVIVICLIGLLASVAIVNITSVLGRHKFKGQAGDLVATLQQAAAAAAQSSRRYEVIIDLPSQSYTFREIASADLAADVLQEEIIRQHTFGNDVHIKYVQFDDGDVAAEGQAKFRAGRAGWQYGGKIVLVDEEGRDYTIMVNRLSRIVELLNGDVEMLAPREDMGF